MLPWCSMPAVFLHDPCHGHCRMLSGCRTGHAGHLVHACMSGCCRCTDPDPAHASLSTMQRQALRELETTGGSPFLRGDLVVGSPPFFGEAGAAGEAGGC